MNCPGCAELVDQIAETSDTFEVKKWGARKPHRIIEQSSLYCPNCERIFVTNSRTTIVEDA